MVHKDLSPIPVLLSSIAEDDLNAGPSNRLKDEKKKVIVDGRTVVVVL